MDLTADPFVAAYPETLPFWQAAAEGRFLLKHCRQCGRTHWYPRALCPHCHSSDLEWRESAGRGSVYSFTVVRRAEPPYVLGYVHLDEGPKLLTNIVDCDPDSVQIGQRVSVIFRPAPEGRPMPFFRPSPA
jgi:uncharacterized OB-fold protein